MRDGNAQISLPFIKKHQMVLEVTMRDGNLNNLTTTVTPMISFRSDYEGWKRNLVGALRQVHTLVSVLEVTMRDGNSPNHLSYFTSIKVSFRSDYEGWKRFSQCSFSLHYNIIQF